MSDELAAYRQAVLEIGVHPRLVLRAETPLTPEQLEALQTIGLGRHAAIVTPFNPVDERLPAGENQRRLDQLARELADAGINALPADGGSADGTHMESGFAIDVGLEQALAIGRRWGQSAIFWFDGRIVRMVQS